MQQIVVPAVHVPALLLVALLLTGCASNPPTDSNPDPFEKFNRGIYKFNVFMDKAVFRPVAKGYMRFTPQPVRRSVGNFFTNLTGPNVVLNDLLQGKVAQGVDDTARFVFNSTFGIGGLFDVASSKGLEQHEEDFGQTLAVWGIARGPYLMVPALGPFTLRETAGGLVSYLTYPLFWVDNIAITAPLAALGFVDLRARSDAAIEFVEESAVDPYAFTREGYLQRRQFLIYDGNPPVEDLLDDLDPDSLFEEEPQGESESAPQEADEAPQGATPL